MLLNGRSRAAKMTGCYSRGFWCAEALIVSGLIVVAGWRTTVAALEIRQTSLDQRLVSAVMHDDAGMAADVIRQGAKVNQRLPEADASPGPISTGDRTVSRKF
jgi:hypothetical protein